MARVIEMLETLPPYYTTFRAILYQERIAEKVIKFHQSIIPDPVTNLVLTIILSIIFSSDKT